jgi:hypothetical protein
MRGYLRCRIDIKSYILNLKVLSAKLCAEHAEAVSRTIIRTKVLLIGYSPYSGSKSRTENKYNH